MDLQDFRRRHPRWARFWLLDDTTKPSHPRRAARWLMSLASLGMFLTAMTALAGLMLALGFLADPQSATFQQLQADLRTVPTAWFAVWWILNASIQFLTLLALRRLARALYAGPLLSMQVAQGFGSLGNWLLLGWLTGLLTDLAGLWFVPDARFTLGSGPFITIVLVLLCKVVGRIVAEGAQAADENRGFV